MSGAALKWARVQDFGAPHLQALVLALAARVGPQGTTFVSQATLANDLRINARQVRKSLATLQRLGVISRQPRSNGKQGRTSDLITLALHKQFLLTPAKVREAVATGTTGPLAAKVATGPTEPGAPVLQAQGIVREQHTPSQEGENSRGSIGQYARGTPRLAVLTGGRS